MAGVFDPAIFQNDVFQVDVTPAEPPRYIEAAVRTSQNSSVLVPRDRPRPWDQRRGRVQ